MNAPVLMSSQDALEAENARLRKVIAALVERAESGDELQRTDFGIFQTTVLLEDQVRARTPALDLALRQLEDANRALRQSRAELQAIFELAPYPLAVTLPEDGTFLSVSRSFAEFFEVEPETMLGRRSGPDDFGFWPSQEDRARFLAALEAGDGRLTDFPISLTRVDGSVAHLVLSGRTLDSESRRLLLIEFHDVTQATRDAMRLRDLAEHDPLTGLPNRLLLLERLGQAVAAASRSGARLAVCYLDLDGFKAVNDRFGHAAGDYVLTETGRRLLGVVRASDTVGRLGGDEFAILLLNVSGFEECEVILQRALRAITQPLEMPGLVGAVSTSIGYTIFPDDGVVPEQLLERADEALYQAKHAGKNRCVRFAG